LQEFSEFLKNVYEAKIKVVKILTRIDEVLKCADDSIDIVRRNSGNIQYLRTGVFGGRLVSVGSVEVEMRKTLDR
jgi:hypothetical protein